MGNERSPAPPGALVELSVDLIDEGKLKGALNAKLKQTLRELLEFEKETMTRDASAQVTLTIKMSRTKGSTEFFDIEYGAASKVPVVTRGTSVKEVGGRLLCQPAGSSDDSPDQQLFFDSRGRIIGGVDPETGEAHEPPVAGRIGAHA